MFVHDASSVYLSFGYHPDHTDLATVLGLVTVTHLLVLGPPDAELRDRVAEMRHTTTAEVELPAGLYWFAETSGVRVMQATGGSVPVSSQLTPAAGLDHDHPLAHAAGWMDALWAEAKPIPRPRFQIHDDVVVTQTGKDYAVRERRFSGETWIYGFRAEGLTTSWAESFLEKLTVGTGPLDWIRGPLDSAERLSATLTRAKLAGSFSDTVFSFRATRTLFRGYQFKPVIRMLESGKFRILIADEVGLGKTIEAGLIWTELEARGAADRVLVVCPSALVAKWTQEMSDRFEFTLQELSGAALEKFASSALENRLPRRFAHIISIERLRTWDGLQEMVELAGPLNLAIVDEAHIMRNSQTRSFQAGALLSEWAEALVLLTATPINLRNQDLFNLLELLTPGEFGKGESLELQLAPNAVLNRLSRALTTPGVTATQRISILDELRSLVFGRPVLQRPEVPLLRELLGQQVLAPRDIVAAKRYLEDLNALSAVLTRTRRVEVDEKKAVRQARDVEVPWTAAELAFYNQYVLWCKARADFAGVPLGFAMQMPLRLASACLPAARDAALEWTPLGLDPQDEDDVNEGRSPAAVPPHVELLDCAARLGQVDSKYDLLERNLTELIAGGRQALVFSFSRPTLAYLEGRLNQHHRVAVLHGGVPPHKRHTIIAAFREGQYDLLLANRVASEGLDFEFCSVVVNYDLPWNPMEVEQRIGRIDRIGQTEEKISILNLWCPAALDEQMKQRLLQRIGVFEGTIGALEPIITAHLSNIRDIAFDFSLTPEQQQRKADDVLTAIEAQRSSLADHASASAFLLAAGSADIAGMEADLLKSGRYIGPQELVLLLRDWAQASSASQPQLSRDGRVLFLRGNREMAEALQQLTQSGRLQASETQAYRAALLGGGELPLTLDHELARTAAGDLLSARHPLVLTASSVPEQRNARFASVAVPGNSLLKAGRYVVLLEVATWKSVRPGREIWAVALNAEGTVVGSEYADCVLAGLAQGDLRQGTDTLPDNLESTVRTAIAELDSRMLREILHREQEAAALLGSRRALLQDQFTRRLEAIGARLTTALDNDSVGVRLFEGQIRRTRENHVSTLASIDSLGSPNLSVTQLALCLLEVGHGE